MNSQDQTPMISDFSPDPAPIQCPNDTNSVSKVWRTVAIIEAVCILIVALFAVWSCLDIHPHKSMEKIGAVSFNDVGFENLSSVPGYPFTFDVKEEIPMHWDISVNHYGFDMKTAGQPGDSYVGDSVLIKDGETIYWTMYDNDGRQDPPPAGKRIFLEAILYSQEDISANDSVSLTHVMGYCVIEIFIDDPGGKYSAKMLDSAYYPQRNGKYQNITTEYVLQQIENAKK